MPLPLSSRAKSRDPYSSCRKKKRILRLALLALDDNSETMKKDRQNGGPFYELNYFSSFA